jgi:hypothetical protein
VATEQARFTFDGITGGISRQPARNRYPGQAQDAKNVIYDPANGVVRRWGSRFLAVLDEFAGLAADADVRIHPIMRDSVEQYGLLYGAGVVSIRTKDGVKGVVYAGRASSYLGSSPAASIRCVSIGDYTLLLNTTVVPASKSSDSYTLDRECRTYEILTSRTPAPNATLRATDDSPAAAPGYWRYKPGLSTFATMRMDEMDSNWSGVAIWLNRDYNPMGARVFFSTFLSSQTNCTWVQATKTLTKTGAFTNWTFEPNKFINITAGTGFTPTHARITSRVNNDSITLEYAVPPANTGTVAFIDIGDSVDFRVDMNQAGVADLQDVAAALQRAIRNAGAVNALVSFTSMNTAGGAGADRGYFTITSPWSGKSASFPSSGAVLAPLDPEVYALATAPAGRPFRLTGMTIAAGTGLSDLATSTPEDRWVRVPPPGQATAQLNPQTMPVALIRTALGGVWPGGWSAMTISMRPLWWWRLGDTSGTVAVEQMKGANGTYVAAPTLGVAGTIAGDTNTAVTFNGTTQSVTLPALDGFEAAVANGFTFECKAKVNTGAIGTILGLTAVVSRGFGGVLTSVAFAVYANKGPSGFANGFMTVSVNGREFATAIATPITAAGMHEVVVTHSGQGGTLQLSVDGTDYPLTETGVGPFSVLSTPGQPSAGNIGSTFSGTIDEVIIWQGVLDATVRNNRRQLYLNASYSHPPTFVLRELEWGFRPDGSPESNPLPELLASGRPIADIGFFDNRLLLIGGERVLCSANNDYYQFFVENPANITDDDPIQRSVVGDKESVVDLDFAVPIRSVLTLFSKAGQQFDFSAVGDLTPSSASITMGTRYKSAPGVRPVASDARVFFAGAMASSGTLYEYAYSDTETLLFANNVGSHVPGLLLPTIKSIDVAPGSNMVLVLPTDGSVIYTYSYFYNGSEKLQSAWSVWEFGAGNTVRSMAVLDRTLMMIVKRGSQYTLESHSLSVPVAENGTPYVPCLDRVMVIRGVFAAGTTTWTLPGGLTDTSITAIVKPDGTELVATTSPGTTVTRTGDHSATDCVLGRPMVSFHEPTPPFVRDGNGRVVSGSYAQILSVIVGHKDSGSYRVRCVQRNRADRVRTMVPGPPYSASGAQIEEEGEFEANVGGDARDTRIIIESITAKPMTITSLGFLIDRTIN